MMSRYQHGLLAFASISLVMVTAARAQGASLTEVTADWKGGVSLPSYVKFYIYVPDAKASKPPIMVSSHSCGSTASGQLDAIKNIRAAADKYGFIIIFPDNPGQNCWDVGSDKSLKHDGGGDTHAVAQMVRYTLSKYNGDTSRVYAMGGSSGGMMTQALMAVYPDIFRAGAARAGVPAGCWAVQYDQGGTRQWSVPCANGQVLHTPEEWGKIVLAMYPSYTGHRPRIQLIQGGNDTTISSTNMQESIDEWTNVLGLSATATSKDSTTTSIATYNRQFWENSCGYVVLESWVAPGKDHSMGYEEAAILKFFGLDSASTADPEPDCTGDAGVGGAGGASSIGGESSSGGAKNTGGSKNAGGTSSIGTKSTGGVSSSGGVFTSGGASTALNTASTGGAKATGGNGGVAGSKATGGVVGTGGAVVATGGSKAATGGAVSTGGIVAAGGSVATSSVVSAGGSASTGGVVSTGGAAQGDSSTSTEVESTRGASTQPEGCSCRIAGQPSRSRALIGAALLGLLLLRPRRRRSR